MNAPNRLTKTLGVKTVLLLVSMGLATLTACTTVKVVPDDRTVTFLKAGQSYTAQRDSVVMSTGLYRTYRQAVSDLIYEREKHK